MKARYVDLPSSAIPCFKGVVSRDSGRINWSSLRGTDTAINPVAIGPNGLSCDGPFFLDVLHKHPNGSSLSVCIHLIELDESALDAEVDQVSKELTLSKK